jgi:hypothetical protein
MKTEIECSNRLKMVEVFCKHKNYNYGIDFLDEKSYLGGFHDALLFVLDLDMG